MKMSPKDPTCRITLGVNGRITSLNQHCSIFMESQKIVNGDVDLNSLIISKTLKSTYKDPTKIAHKVLAERIGKREPGNKPAVGSRIPFVYIQTKGKVKLQGDRIEHVDYIKKNNIPVDYEFYITNQIMNPVKQVLDLRLDPKETEKLFLK